jgi:hypothetical protein
MFQTIQSEEFEKDLKKILKEYPKSKKRIETEIESLSEKVGDRYPGFGNDLHVRKVRIGLPEYKVSKSDGLRIICMFIIVEKKKIPLAIYHKKKTGKEQKIKKHILHNLQKILSTL